MNYFVTAIDTDSGKTLVSAIICEMLQADYWKPVQAGFPKDSDTVKSLISNKRTIFNPETYLLNTPASPHAAAKLDGVNILLENFILPKSENLVIEGAGGCLVPLNSNHFVIDLVTRLNCQVILVADLYLGSINHTLLTAECLAHRNIRVKGIVFNGDRNELSEEIILKHTGYKRLLHISRESSVTKDTVLKYATMLKSTWDE